MSSSLNVKALDWHLTAAVKWISAVDAVDQ